MRRSVARRWVRGAVVCAVATAFVVAASERGAVAAEPAVEVAQAQGLIPEGDFEALLKEVERSNKSKDQLDLIEIMAEDYDFSAKQARDLVKAVKPKKRVAAAVLLYEHIAKKKKFFVVLAALEDKQREKVRKRLGLDDDGDGEDSPKAEQVAGMSEKDFKSLKRDLKRMKNDKARLTLLEAASDVNQFESQQAREILEMMKRSDAKVDAAVMLYPQIVDTKKYFLVLAALDSDTDRRLVQRDLNIGYTDDEFVADVITTVNPNGGKGHSHGSGSASVTVTVGSGGSGTTTTSTDVVKKDPPAITAMGAASFLDFKKQVAGESFSDDKKNLVSMVSSGNYFTTAQVRELLDVFSFEDDKVDVAVMLYTRVVDRENFYKVFDAFTFSSSKDELRERLNL